MTLSFAAMLLATLALTPFLAEAEDTSTTRDWPITGGDAGGARYSQLREIDRENVNRLRVAWTYRHGDYRSGGILPDHIA
jgi:glucose dehydrogenase